MNATFDWKFETALASQRVLERVQAKFGDLLVRLMATFASNSIYIIILVSLF